MTLCLLYLPSTGRIIGHSSGEYVDGEIPGVKKQPTSQIVSGDDYYLVNGEPTERPASPVTLDGLTIKNVPEGSAVWCDGQSYSAEGDVELEFPLLGTYTLRVEAWPYKDWVGEVTV